MPSQLNGAVNFAPVLHSIGSPRTARYGASITLAALIAKVARRPETRGAECMPPRFAEYYDAVIDWEKRLAREMSLLAELARQGGSRVLVPACGTGGHVVALAQRGFFVLGFDADEDAVEFTRRRIEAAANSIAATAGEASVRVLGMEEAQQWRAAYDVAYCLGNALPGLSLPGQLPAAIRGVAGALRPGGIFLTQNLNYDRRWQEKAHWFPLLSGETAREEVLLVKFADYEPEFINFHTRFLAREKPAGQWQSHVRTSRQIPLFQDSLAQHLREAGFGNLRFWGDYAKSPFDRAKSNDLIVAAERLE